jgi:serine/threonine protein kinase
LRPCYALRRLWPGLADTYFPRPCFPQGVANRDIKLENSLLDGSLRPLVKLADFGCSKDENFHSAPGSCVGTPAYLAPEVMGNTTGQPYDGKVRWMDGWSLSQLQAAESCGGHVWAPLLVRSPGATLPRGPCHARSVSEAQLSCCALGGTGAALQPSVSSPFALASHSTPPALAAATATGFQLPSSV